MSTFETYFRIFFGDISPSGRIHIDRLAEWMAIARERYLISNYPDYLSFIEGSIKMFTRQMNVIITGRSRWTDEILVSLNSSSVKRFSFDINAIFKNIRTKEIIARGRQKVVFVDIHTGRFADIPSELKRCIIRYQKD